MGRERAVSHFGQRLPRETGAKKGPPLAAWRGVAATRVGVDRTAVALGPTTLTRGWYSVRGNDTRGYASEQQILSDRDLKLQVIASAKAELLTFIAKYHIILGDFGRIIPDLQRIITAIETEIGELERLAT